MLFKSLKLNYTILSKYYYIQPFRKIRPNYIHKVKIIIQ